MDYYEDIYKKRVNRFGTDFQSRLIGEREYAFENYLKRSVYTKNIMYDGELITVSFEPYKQDETKLLHYLLTRRNVHIPNGTILEIPNRVKIGDTETIENEKWMLYWAEENEPSGYNRYVMLRMTHLIEWTGRDKKTHTTWAYMYGQEDNMLKDELKSRSRSKVLYNENLKLSFLIMPKNEFIRKEDYFVIHHLFEPDGEIQEGYRVTGYDLISTLGVEYVTVDPMYLKDLTPPPTPQPGDDDDEFFWINSGE